MGEAIGREVPWRGAKYDFVAIDFETANETRGSACAVGLAAVSGNQVVEQWATLIDPQVPFSDYNRKVHGLDEDAVRGAPTFRDLWPRLSEVLDGARVVAHNASFDISVLRNAAARYEVEGGPSFDLFCSYRLSKLVWREYPSYSLRYLGPKLGIEFAHHEAGDDATACAQVTRALCETRNAETLEELAVSLGVSPGRMTPESFLPFSVYATDGLGNEFGREDADPNHPLFGKSICFTGTLMSMPRRDAKKRVTDIGCDFKSGVSKKLNYLVVGDADFAEFADGWQTNKIRKATQLRSEGADLEVIPERVFLELLLS